MIEVIKWVYIITGIVGLIELHFQQKSYDKWFNSLSEDEQKWLNGE